MSMEIVAQFYTDLFVKKELSHDSTAYWPQARAMLWTMRRDEIADEFFMDKLYPWLYCNATTSWEAETENLFAYILEQRYDTGSIAGVGPLLNAWTRRGTQLPVQPYHQKLIQTFFEGCDIATGTRLVAPLPCLASLLPKEKHALWLEGSIAYARSQERVDIPQVLFAYLHGGHCNLTQAQKEGANRMILDPDSHDSSSFAWLPALQQYHPEPEQLQIQAMRSVLSWGLNSGQHPRKRNAAFEDLHKHYYPTVFLPVDTVLQAEALLIAAVLARDACSWSYGDGWYTHTPAHWEPANAVLPVLESLVGLASDPKFAEQRIRAMAQMWAPTLANAASSFSLPPEYSADVSHK